MPGTPRTSPPAHITDEVVADIARRASVDPRSVVRRLAGMPVRGLSGARIDRELARRGIPVTSRGESSHAA